MDPLLRASSAPAPASTSLPHFSVLLCRDSPWVSLGELPPSAFALRLCIAAAAAAVSGPGCGWVSAEGQLVACPAFWLNAHSRAERSHSLLFPVVKEILFLTLFCHRGPCEQGACPLRTLSAALCWCGEGVALFAEHLRVRTRPRNTSCRCYGLWWGFLLHYLELFARCYHFNFARPPLRFQKALPSPLMPRRRMLPPPWTRGPARCSEACARRPPGPHLRGTSCC